MKILYFAQAADATECAEEYWEMATSLSIDEFWTEAIRRHPGLADIKDHCRIASGGEYANNCMQLNPKLEVAVIPPVSGG